MLYANSPAIQARIAAYVRKPSLAPLDTPGGANIRLAAQYERQGHLSALSGSLNRNILASAALHELSTPNPED